MSEEGTQVLDFTRKSFLMTTTDSLIISRSPLSLGNGSPNSLYERLKSPEFGFLVENNLNLKIILSIIEATSSSRENFFLVTYAFSSISQFTVSTIWFIKDILESDEGRGCFRSGSL